MVWESLPVLLCLIQPNYTVANGIKTYNKNSLRDRFQFAFNPSKPEMFKQPAVPKFVTLIFYFVNYFCHSEIYNRSVLAPALVRLFQPQ